MNPAAEETLLVFGSILAIFVGDGFGVLFLASGLTGAWALRRLNDPDANCPLPSQSSRSVSCCQAGAIEFDLFSGFFVRAVR